MPSIIKEITDTPSEYGNCMADFEILSELGRGSYGIVYKVKAHKDNNVYALKKIPMKHMKVKHQREALQEMLLLKRLSHQNIIRYYASFIEYECLHILMEYAAGGDLYAMLKKMKGRKKYFAEKEIWRYAQEIGQGLGYLHSHCIIHRDIKCLNIFLNENKSIKVNYIFFAVFLSCYVSILFQFLNLYQIGDLGVSKIVANSGAMQGTRVGTPLYLSPELVKQQPYDYKVDIWATGCVLYHIACLEPPFTGENLIVLGNNIVSKQPNPLPSVYSTRLHSFILRLMSKRAADRPSATEMMKNLPEPFKKEAGILTETGTEEEAATLATNEGLGAKQQVKTQTQKFMKAAIQSPPLHRKSLDRDSASSKNNVVKIVNAEIFQEHLKPKQDNYILKPYAEPLPKPNQSAIAFAESKMNAGDASPQSQSRAQMKVVDVEDSPRDISKKFTEETKAAMIQMADQRSSEIPKEPFQAASIQICSKRPDSAASSQRTRLTLSLFRSIDMNNRNLENPHLIARPISAKTELFVVPLTNKERLFDQAEGRCTAEPFNRYRERGNAQKTHWCRPQSAMPLGKAAVLPIIVKPAYQTYCLLSYSIEIITLRAINLSQQS